MPLNIKKSSLQRIFEYALKGIRKQGALGSDGVGCVYETQDGTCCALGLMMTAEQRAAAMKKNVGAIIGNPRFFEPMVGPMPKVFPDNDGPFGNAEQVKTWNARQRKWGLLQALQKAHDNAGLKNTGDHMPDFEQNMQKVAEAYGLRYAAPGVTLRT